MQKRAGLLTAFLLVILLSISVLFVFRHHTFPALSTAADFVTTPIQQNLYGLFGGIFSQTRSADEQEKHSLELAKKIVDQGALIKETKALRDQYDKQTIPSQNLLPARVIGMKSFIPRVSLPEEIVLDKGNKQKVKKGQTVILANNVIGNVIQVSENRSLVSLITNKNQSFTGRTVKTNAIGIIKGKGNGMITLENVVLSDKLERGDLVSTKGDQSVDGSGYPPDLVVGRITSIDKKASDLFQTAEVKSLIDFVTLDTVFIITDD